MYPAAKPRNNCIHYFWFYVLVRYRYGLGDGYQSTSSAKSLTYAKTKSRSSPTYTYSYYLDRKRKQPSMYMLFLFIVFSFCVHHLHQLQQRTILSISFYWYYIYSLCVLQQLLGIPFLCTYRFNSYLKFNIRKPFIFRSTTTCSRMSPCWKYQKQLKANFKYFPFLYLKSTQSRRRL